jgi:hypothetical protein
VLVALYSGAEPVTPAEFAEAVKPLAAGLEADTRTNGFWATAAVGLHAHASRERVAHVRALVPYWRSLALGDVHFAAGIVRAALPWPLPVHLVVGVSGGVSFVPPGKPRRGGKRGGRAGDEAAEWAALMAQVAAVDVRVGGGEGGSGSGSAGGGTA